MSFVTVKVDWYTSTMIFYLAIIFGSYFLTAKKSHYVIIMNKRKLYIHTAQLLMAFMILLFVKGFGTTGRDLRNGYYYLFLSAKSLKNYQIFDNTIEKGFQILSVLIYSISNQYGFFIFVTALLTLYPIYVMLKKYSDNIDLPIAILLYTTCFFVNGLSLIRIYLAASIAIFAYDAMNENRPVAALLWIILSSLIHVSSLILILPFLISMAKVLSRKIIVIGLIFILLTFYFGRGSLAAMLFASGGRYSFYTVSDNGFGFSQLIYYIPLFILFYYGKRVDSNRQFTRVAFSYLSVGLFVGLLSYIVNIFGRMEAHFLPIIIIVAYYCRLLKNRYPKSRSLLNFLIMFYCIARFILYITQMYNSDDIMPYTNIFGWII